jgi:hypothetical protein
MAKLCPTDLDWPRGHENLLRASVSVAPLVLGCAVIREPAARCTIGSRPPRAAASRNILGYELSGGQFAAVPVGWLVVCLV